MDYLNPKKEQQHRIILLVGYVCVAIAIVIAAIILLYQAYGFGVGRNGAVIQNDLTFFSSQPHPANIYVNGKLKDTTNTRLSLPAGIYRILLSRDGYRDWQRTIELEGGNVEHFDYPLLFPKTLISKKLQSFTAAPGLVTQSPDRRWLLVETPGTMTSFQVYDLKNPTKAPDTIDLPANLLTKATSGESWQLEEWAGDNQHLVLQHMYDGKSEFILVDRIDPAKSLNLNTTLSAAPSKLTLRDKKYDHYYLYGVSPDLLQSASLEVPAPVTVLEHVLAYHSYGADTLLYATDSDVPSGKVAVKLKDGDKTYAVHTFVAGTTYVLDLAKYSGKLYVAAGASSENKAYIYKDPIGQLQALPDQALVPAQVLHVTDPSYLSFSTNAQFIVTENATRFGVYDIENTKGYNYTSKQPLDADAQHATWMDGDRLTYVSGGKLVVFDYDHTNQQTLMSAAAAYLSAFAPDYRDVYAVAPAALPDQFELTQTSLLIPADR
ncbi:MAG: PEGA domain-containing protein [Candidatus Saccharimonadales bacterium]